ncbi:MULTISPECIES: TRAP transporter substrate-binding protein DctP [unclassified Cobetia]|uniref:TRAP transporter substrate-binding protein n=1 Tax=unclassified Cobetia TaxID=2609414 RepID=UPI00209803C9|nr:MULTISPECIES: TRAP transporter substrate-binding protein DctP [unclassified Cobetia]MCO7232801.1 TRAP transporter substrate-binding protein DctP [Cobetia sp. Dlab-2-AX]MCO7236211.1 TRAP transporter substrate-binding protein DctP [Cobetia sp. Dlab-2-U]
MTMQWNPSPEQNRETSRTPVPLSRLAALIKGGALASGLGMAALASAGVQADTWRFALEEVSGSVQDAYAQEFKKRIEEASGGDIDVEIYPYGALGTSSQLTELVQSDAIQLTFASPGHLASVIPESGVFTLHFLFSDDNAINEEVLGSSKAIDMLSEAYTEQNLQLLGVIPEGWMVWTGNRDIKTPEDMEGFKIRTMTSPILVESYRGYGANPTPMPYSEVYSGLQLGQIDGQVNPVFAIQEMSFYEVQDYMIQAKQAQFITTLVASSDFYSGLDDEQQQMLDKVTNEMRPYIFEKQEEYNADRLEKIKEDSDIEIITLTDEQREAFRPVGEKGWDVYREQAGERGSKILDTLQADIKAAEGK